MDRTKITEFRECKTHGYVKYVKNHAGFRCSYCLKDNVQRRRRELKHRAVAYKGGKCESCGYCKSVAALDFHHVDSSTKEFGISAGGWTRTWERMKPELDKCILLCSNCHRELHSKIGE